MKKVLVITGPTASGKTSVGFELAKKFNVPIISADSRSIYKGLDIGAAKPTIDSKNIKQYHDEISLVTEIDGLKHYLIEVAQLEDSYTAKNWVDEAKKIIDFYHHKNITPVIVGGTGLYIEALIKGYQFPQIATSNLESLKSLSLRQKQQQLKTLDPKSYAAIDLKNPVRVERALAFTMETNQSFIEAQQFSPPDWQTKIIVIGSPRKILYERIDTGLDKRFAMGLIEEVKNLIAKGYKDKLKNLGLEYRFVTQYLEGEFDLEEMSQKLKFAIHAFARRQLTWWRKRENIDWVDSPQKALREAERFIKS